MKIVLIFPPTADPTAPYISVPVLSGFLRTRGIRVVPIDANLEAYEALFQREVLAAQLERISERFDRLDRKPGLGHTEQLEYAVLAEALKECRDVPERIGEALAVLRDREGSRFYDPGSYNLAVMQVEGALQLIGTAYAPLRIHFSAYRSPFSLLSAQEIEADAEKGKNPFHTYYEDELIPRLMQERPRLIGLSLAYTSQMQPAYSLASMIRRKVPGAYLTMGGAAVTQLFCRTGRDRVSETLGPFDSAVLFEGEEALHQMVEELRSGRHPQGIRIGSRTSDLSRLPAPDFEGLPLEKYLSPEPVLPYDATRGCYWGKCAFCRYGLTEKGAAPYRERSGETAAEHLVFLARKHRSRIFYLSQDSISPDALVDLAESLVKRNSPVRWATDARAEKAFAKQGVCELLKKGGALSISLGIESAAVRVLKRIRKGIPIGIMRKVLNRLARSGIAAEAMLFTDFPTETYDESLETLRLIRRHRQDISLFICGTFALTHGTAVAEDPEKYGIEETWQVKGDRWGLELFYATEKPAKTGEQQEALDRAIRRLSGGWLLRSYPWAGSLSTAHTLLWYERYGPDIFKRLAEKPERERLRKNRLRRTRYDPEKVGAAAFANEDRIWQELVYTHREVSRDLYARLAGACPEARPSKIRSTKSEIRNKTPNPKSKT